MSQEIREKALSAAVAVAAAEGVAAVVAAAQKFEAYITGGAASPKASAPTSASPKTTTSGASAPAAKPAANTKAAPGSATTASKPAKAASAPKKDEVDPDAKKMVGDKVNELLKANLREEAVALLASFGEATSATGIVKQGDEVTGAFMEQADALLTAAAEAGGLAD